MNFFKELLVNSHDGNYLKIVDIIAHHFSQYTSCEIIVQNITYNKSNVIVKWGNPELLINVHIDTVPPANGWISDPYELVEIDDNFYGLGTCDTKGNIFAISEAIKFVTPKNLMLLFSVDEESNTIESGVTHFLKSDFAQNIKQVIVCEPTKNLVEDSHKGYYSFYLKAYTDSKHSSETEYLYYNSIYKIGKYFKTLIEEGYNLGTIHGGIAGNIIAPDCCLLISIRSNDDYEFVFNNLKSILGDEIIIETKTILPALKCKSLSVESEIIINHNFSQSSKLSNLGKEWNQSSSLDFWTEAALFNQKGINAVIYGVGDIRQAHTPNEYVSKDSLFKGIQFFIDVIYRENEK
jgi:acetylornithine deacetylase